MKLLNNKARSLLLWAELNLESIRVEHIHGVKNVLANWLSQKEHPNVFQHL